jgi:hypothetical protein
MTQPDFDWTAPVQPFDGKTYDAARDGDRLNAQLGRVFHAMRDSDWWTLAQLSCATGDPEGSVSARIRDLRKPKFGGHLMERRYVSAGLWEYRLSAGRS